MAKLFDWDTWDGICTPTKIYDMRLAYRTAMDNLQRSAWHTSDDDQDAAKENAIKFFMRMLRINLFGSNLTKKFIEYEDRDRACSSKIIPDFLRDKEADAKNIKIQVGDNSLLSAPRHFIKADFIATDSGKDRINGIFYPELELVVLTDGQRHSNLSRLQKETELIVDMYRVTPYFPIFDTDGAFWFYAGTKDKKERVLDVRFAILYSLAKKLWEVQNDKKD